MEKILKRILVGLLIIALFSAVAFTAYRFVSKKNNSNKVEDKVEDKEEKEEVEKEESKNPKDILLFNSKMKEIELYNESESEAFFINGDKLEKQKQLQGEVKGLVPYKLDGRLFFIDLDFQTIVETCVNNNKEIGLDLILKDKDVDLEKVENIFLSNNVMYVTLRNKINEEDEEDTSTERNVVEINLGNKAVKKYNSPVKPTNLFRYNDNIYYMDNDHLIKANAVEGKLKELNRVELGDDFSDFIIKENYLYALSKFGKKENDSVLMKMDLNDLKVKDIMSLKGVDSTFIGIEDGIAYISQKNSIKEVDIKTFESLRAFNRDEDEDVQYVDSNLYKLIGQELKKITTKDLKIDKNIKTRFDDFYVIKDKASLSPNSTKLINNNKDENDEVGYEENTSSNKIKENDLLWGVVRNKIKEEYSSKEGSQLTKEELDRLTNQIVENEDIWEELNKEIIETIKNEDN